MADSERTIKKMLGWFLGLCLVVPAVGVSAIIIVDQIRIQQTCRGFASFPAKQQLHWLRYAGSNRDGRFVEPVRATLQNSQDRVMLEAAGYAAMRMNATELLPLLQKRADELPDDVQRAQLINYASQVSNRDARLYDWLMKGIQSNEPWRRAGSAIGLMHIGRIEAGPLLSGIVRQGPAETKALAMQYLVWITRPIGQAIGQPLAFADASPPPTDAVSLDQIDQLWQKHVTVKLLNDVLTRLSNRDPDWAEMNRLIHARNKIAKWLQ